MVDGGGITLLHELLWSAVVWCGGGWHEIRPGNVTSLTSVGSLGTTFQRTLLHLFFVTCHSEERCAAAQSEAQRNFASTEDWWQRSTDS